MLLGRRSPSPPEAEAMWTQCSMQPDLPGEPYRPREAAELRSYLSSLGAAPFLQAVQGCASPWKR